MNGNTKVALAGVALAAAILAFFSLPFVYVYSIHGGPYIQGEVNTGNPVYVSLSCKVLGVGEIYSPGYGLATACDPFRAGWPLPV